MIRFENVSFAYRGTGQSLSAVEGVSFDLSEGGSLALLGANGSGKSTVVRLMNGLLLPSSGSVMVDGIATSDGSRIADLRRRVGVVFQRPDDQIVATSVLDEVAFGPENLGLPRGVIAERVDAALGAVGLRGLEEREPHQLSGGQKQRLALAGALAMEPPYLVLDEPTSLLDPRAAEEVIAAVRALHRAGHGVAVVTHDLGEVMWVDSVIVLDGGKIVYSGTPPALLALPADMLGAWGIEASPLWRLASLLEHGGVSGACCASSPAELVDALCR